MRRNHAHQKGMTFIELMAATAAGMMLLAILTMFFTRARESVVMSENEVALTQIGQRITANLRESISNAAKIFTPTSVQVIGSGETTLTSESAIYNMIKNSLTAAPAAMLRPVAWSKHPPLYVGTSTIFDDPTCFDPSSGPILGNQLAFVALMQPLRFKISFTYNSKAVYEMAVVDCYQFRMIYLGQNPKYRVHSGNPCLSLMEWRSVPVISKRNLDSLAGLPVRLTATTTALASSGFSLAWDPSAAELGFATLKTNSVPGYTALTGTPSSLSTQTWDDLGMRSPQATNPSSSANQGTTSGFGQTTGISGFQTTYTVAYNNTTATSQALRAGRYYSADPAWKGASPGQGLKVPVYAVPTTAGFPGGFECMISGPASAHALCATITLAARGVGVKDRGVANSYRVYRTQCLINYKDSY